MTCYCSGDVSKPKTAVVGLSLVGMPTANSTDLLAQRESMSVGLFFSCAL